MTAPAAARHSSPPPSSASSPLGDAPTEGGSVEHPDDVLARPIHSRAQLFRWFLNEREDPEPFYSGLARRWLEEFPYDVAGKRILDLGSGPGYYSEVLRAAGATVVALDLSESNARKASVRGGLGVVGDAQRLPLPAGRFDGVCCSNLLEHVPDPDRVIDELQRVLRPGGWAWVSWTNWYSPWGGHDITPFHLLGPRLGSRTYHRLFGPPRKNPPYDGLWPTYVGAMLADARQRAGMRLVDAHPRYYPAHRWVLRVPGLREVATWNCVLRLERVGDARPTSA